MTLKNERERTREQLRNNVTHTSTVRNSIAVSTGLWSVRVVSALVSKTII